MQQETIQINKINKIVIGEVENPFNNRKYYISLYGKALHPLYTNWATSSDELLKHKELFLNFVAEKEAKKKERSLKRNAERKIKAEQAIKDINLGDIYVSSWGYDQTNIDFYKVIAIKGRKVTFIEIGHYTDETKNQQWCSKYVLPSPEREIGQPFNKIVNGPYISLTSYSSMSKWDGRARNETSYA